jgi:AAA domain
MRKQRHRRQRVPPPNRRSAHEKSAPLAAVQRRLAPFRGEKFQTWRAASEVRNTLATIAKGVAVNPPAQASRTLPRSGVLGFSESEACAIVAGWLLNAFDARDATAFDSVADLTPEHFPADKIAEKVFRAARHLHAAGSPINGETVLKTDPSIDGAEFLRLSNSAPTSATFPAAATFLRECFAWRQVSTAAQILAEAKGRGEALPDALRAFDEARERLAAGADTLPAIVSAESFCAKPPPMPPVLLAGILYRGGTVMFSGPSKAHKTYTALAMGLCVASGRDWLGFKTTAAPVLYLNLELPDFAAQKRIADICQRLRIEHPVTFHLWNLRGKRVTEETLRRELPRRIKQLAAGLVMIDPHYKVSSASGAEENSNDSQGRLLSDLETICTPNGAALAVCHHFAKGDASARNSIDRASGGGVLARWGDVIMTLTPHEEEEAMTVEMHLRVFAPVAPFVVKWECPVWIRDDMLDPSRLKTAGAKTKHSEDDTLKALGDEMMTYSEWCKASRLSDTTFRRKRDALLAAGKVEQVGNCYRRKADLPL